MVKKLATCGCRNRLSNYLHISEHFALQGLSALGPQVKVFADSMWAIPLRAMQHTHVHVQPLVG